MQITLPKWYDLHVHLRQDAPVAAYIQAQLAMGCAGVLAMPNTKPPVSKVFDADPGEGWSIEGYQHKLRLAGADRFSALIVPLYLTAETTPEMIKKGAAAGILKACKYYPPHGTTGAEFGRPLDTYIENGVIQAMQDAGVVLCVHGEEHGLEGEAYFGHAQNAEEIFYKTRMPKLIKRFPKLRVVCEHITTAVAAKFVAKAGEDVVASITPQHLLYTVGDMVKGFKYHLFCLPLIKFDKDRQALRDAVLSIRNGKFFAGTDSAPHSKKVTECGCAAGCFTGGIAPQLYAQGFEEAGADLSNKKWQEIFEKFLCRNGPSFYGLPIPTETFTLVKEDSTVELLHTPDGVVTPLPVGYGQPVIPWSIRLS